MFSSGAHGAGALTAAGGAVGTVSASRGAEGGPGYAGHGQPRAQYVYQQSQGQYVAGPQGQPVYTVQQPAGAGGAQPRGVYAAPPPPQGQAYAQQQQYATTSAQMVHHGGGGGPAYLSAPSNGEPSPHLVARSVPPQQQQQYRYVQQPHPQGGYPQPVPSPVSFAAPSPAPYRPSSSSGAHSRISTGPPPPHQQYQQHVPPQQSARPQAGNPSSSFQPRSQPPETIEQQIAASLPPQGSTAAPSPAYVAQQQRDAAVARAMQRERSRQASEQQQQQQAAEEHARAASRASQRRQSVVQPIQEEVEPASRPPPASGVAAMDFAADSQPTQEAKPRERLELPEEGEQRTLFHAYILDYLQKSGYHSAASALLSDIPSIPTLPASSGQIYPSRSGSFSSASAGGSSSLHPTPRQKTLFLASPSALSPPSPAQVTPSPTRSTAAGTKEEEDKPTPTNADTVGSTSSFASSGTGGSHYGFEPLSRRSGDDEGDRGDGASSPRKRPSDGDGRRLPAAMVPITSEQGFLYEWWTVFWDVFRARASLSTAGPHNGGSAAARSFVEASSAAVDLARQREGELGRLRQGAGRMGGGVGVAGRMGVAVPPQGSGRGGAVSFRSTPAGAGGDGASMNGPVEFSRRGSYTGPPPYPMARRGSLLAQQQQQQHQQAQAKEAAMMAARAVAAKGQGQLQQGQPGMAQGRRGALSPDDLRHPAPLPPSSAPPLDPALDAQRLQQHYSRPNPSIASGPATNPEQAVAGGATPPFQPAALAYSPNHLHQASEARDAYRAKLLAAQQKQMRESVAKLNASASPTAAAKGSPVAAPTPTPAPEGSQAAAKREGSMLPPSRKPTGSSGSTPLSATVPLPLPEREGASPKPPADGTGANVGAGKRRRDSLAASTNEREKKRPARPSDGPSPAAGAPTPAQAPTPSSAPTHGTPLPSGLAEVTESPTGLEGGASAASSAPTTAPPPAPTDFTGASAECSGTNDGTEAFLSSLGGAEEQSFGSALGFEAPLDLGGEGQQFSMEQLDALFSTTTAAASFDPLPPSPSTATMSGQVDLGSTAGVGALDDGASFDYNEFLSNFGGDVGYDPTVNLAV